MLELLELFEISLLKYFFFFIVGYHVDLVEVCLWNRLKAILKVYNIQCSKLRNNLFDSLVGSTQLFYNINKLTSFLSVRMLWEISRTDQKMLDIDEEMNVFKINDKCHTIYLYILCDI